MSLIKRLEREIVKLEKHIEKEKMQIENLHDKLESKKITGGEFNIKKKKMEEKIRSNDSRIRVLHGGIAKEKRHLEEKAEEKHREKKEQTEKKEGAKRKEKNYFEWSDKNER